MSKAPLEALLAAACASVVAAAASAQGRPPADASPAHAAHAARAARAAEVPALRFEKYVLPNGLEVILHEDHSTPVVAVNTWYKVGSGDERRGRTGFAHLFEHLMFMGSQHVPTGEADRLLEAAGSGT